MEDYLFKEQKGHIGSTTGLQSEFSLVSFFLKDFSLKNLFGKNNFKVYENLNKHSLPAT